MGGNAYATEIDGRFKAYRSKMTVQARPYEADEDTAKIAISGDDRVAGSPKEGDMIVRAAGGDERLLTAADFAAKYELVPAVEKGAE